MVQGFLLSSFDHEPNKIPSGLLNNVHFARYTVYLIGEWCRRRGVYNVSISTGAGLPRHVRWSYLTLSAYLSIYHHPFSIDAYLYVESRYLHLINLETYILWSRTSWQTLKMTRQEGDFIMAQYIHNVNTQQCF